MALRSVPALLLALLVLRGVRCGLQNAVWRQRMYLWRPQRTR
jgi:hypothetical protein